MKNLLKFLKRNIPSIFLILVLVIAIFFIIRYNDPEFEYFNSAYNATSVYIYEKFYVITHIFTLKHRNQDLLEENANLKNDLKENFIKLDTATYYSVAKFKKDSLEIIRKFKVYAAEVVENTTQFQNNFIILEKGSDQHLDKDMAVVTKGNCLVGITIKSNSKYTKVMTLLNVDCKVSAMLKNSKHSGNIEWDGESPDYVLFRNISKNITVNLGDTVVTSNFSSNFPPNVLIGTVVSEIEEHSTSLKSFKIKLATDFSNLNYVYVIENLRALLQKELNEN